MARSLQPSSSKLNRAGSLLAKEASPSAAPQCFRAWQIIGAIRLGFAAQKVSPRNEADSVGQMNFCLESRGRTTEV
jgi:hypothetical protein